MHDELLRSTKLFVDEMTAPVLDPGRGRTKKGYFWVLARDDRPCAHSQSSAETASPFNRHTPNRWSGQKNWPSSERLLNYETHRSRLGDQMTAAVEEPQYSVEKIRLQALNLFLVGFLVLFLELACIRWFVAYVVFLQFFNNVVLIASFLGMSCGCLAARQSRNWLGYFPLLALVTVIVAVATFAVYHYWSGLSIDVGGQASPQEVFFGTEYRNPDVAQFVVPIEVVAAVFFVLVALMFVGLGQVLGRAFDSYPNRVMGYTLNIGGSLAGIIGFSAISLIQTPPVAWFFISCSGIAYLLHQVGALTKLKALALLTLVLVY